MRAYFLLSGHEPPYLYYPLLDFCYSNDVEMNLGVLFLPVDPETDLSEAFSRKRQLTVGWFYAKALRLKRIKEIFPIDWDPAKEMKLFCPDNLMIHDFLEDFERGGFSQWISSTTPLDLYRLMFGSDYCIGNFLNHQIIQIEPPVFSKDSARLTSFDEVFRKNQNSDVLNAIQYKSDLHATCIPSLILQYGDYWRNIWINQLLLRGLRDYPPFPWRLPKLLPAGTVFAIPVGSGYMLGQVIDMVSILNEKNELCNIGFYYAFFRESFVSLEEGGMQNVKQLESVFFGLGMAHHLDFDLWPILGTQPPVTTLPAEAVAKNWDQEPYYSTLHLKNMLETHITAKVGGANIEKHKTPLVERK